MRGTPREGFCAVSKNRKGAFLRASRAKATRMAADRALLALSGAVDDFVVAIDSMGTVVYADEEALAFLGRRAEDVGRLGVGDLLPPADLAGFARVVGRLFADAPVEMPHELTALGAAGAPARLLMSAWRLDRPDGTGLVVTLLRPAPAAAAACAA